jgi:hypothetical protein
MAIDNWITGITDRNIFDVQHAQDIPSSVEDIKGARNASDLNRIGHNIQALADALNDTGYFITVSPKTDWKKSDIPRRSDIQLIADDVDQVRRAFITFATTPETPELPINTYQKMNDLEKILEDMHTLFGNGQQFVFYAGDVYSGEI